MRAIILAAGAGRRLAPMNWDQPKCLLPCPQGTLLDHAIRSARLCGVDQVVVVVGFRRELLEAALAECPLTVHRVHNEEFATTNTIRSLWKARRFLDEE